AGRGARGGTAAAATVRGATALPARLVGRRPAGMAVRAARRRPGLPGAPVSLRRRGRPCARALSRGGSRLRGAALARPGSARVPIHRRSARAGVAGSVRRSGLARLGPAATPRGVGAGGRGRGVAAGRAPLARGERGSLLHRCLDAFFRRLDEEGRLPLRGDPGELETLTEVAAEEMEAFAAEEHVGRRALWELRRNELLRTLRDIVEAETRPGGRP